MPPSSWRRRGARGRGRQGRSPSPIRGERPLVRHRRWVPSSGFKRCRRGWRASGSMWRSSGPARARERRPGPPEEPEAGEAFEFLIHLYSTPELPRARPDCVPVIAARSSSIHDRRVGYGACSSPLESSPRSDWTRKSIWWRILFVTAVAGCRILFGLSSSVKAFGLPSIPLLPPGRTELGKIRPLSHPDLIHKASGCA